MAVARKGNYTLLETCALRAAFHDDESSVERFEAIASAAASKLGAEVVMAMRRVDPGIGLIILEDDDRVWEARVDPSQYPAMRQALLDQYASPPDEKELSDLAKLAESKLKLRNKGKGKKKS